MITIEQILEVISGSDVVEDMSRFNPDKTFKENGVDSLDVFTVLLAVEERFEVKFTESESDAIRTAIDILNTLNSH